MKHSELITSLKCKESLNLLTQTISSNTIKSCINDLFIVFGNNGTRDRLERSDIFLICCCYTLQTVSAVCLLVRASSVYSTEQLPGDNIHCVVAAASINTLYCPVDTMHLVTQPMTLCYLTRPSLMTFALATQFYVYLPWGQYLLSIVS